jgi:hypothetical protein
MKGMKNLFGSIKQKYYPLLDIFKALSLIGFFLFGFFYLSRFYGLPVFPQTEVEKLLLITFVGFLFLSWLFGERGRSFLVFSYFGTFLIIGLALVTKQYILIPRVLTPVLFTYLSLLLFKSPEEIQREREKREKELLQERLNVLREKINFYKEELKKFENEYQNLLEEKEKLEKLYGELKVEELKKLLEEREKQLEEYEKKIEETERKLQKLKENNRELWQLLESSLEDDTFSDKKRKEIARLRRELKNLKKELKKAKEELEECKDTKELLTLENNELRKKTEEVSKQLEEFKEKYRLKAEELNKCMNLYEKDIGYYLSLLLDKVVLTPLALSDLNTLSENVKRNFVKYLKKLENIDLQSAKFETLTLGKEKIYKDRFSGGRVYFSIKGGKVYIKGILEGEDDKKKDLFIRQRFT